MADDVRLRSVEGDDRSRSPGSRYAGAGMGSGAAGRRRGGGRSGARRGAGTAAGGRRGPRRAFDAEPRRVVAVAAAVLELLPFGGYDALPWMVAGRATRRFHPRAAPPGPPRKAAPTR